jgi:hypothetical protein
MAEMLNWIFWLFVAYILLLVMAMYRASRGDVQAKNAFSRGWSFWKICSRFLK